MTTLNIKTSSKRQIIDITDQVEANLSGNNVMATVFIKHTTAGITLMDLDPGTDLDFLDFLDSLVPDLQWRHPHNPAHAPDHFLASLVGASVGIPVVDGKLQLGIWQRLVLIEFDGPRDRQAVVV